MQALMLAAGMGRRLGKYTEECTKCMIRVGGQTLLERAVEALQLAGVRRLVMVVGWEHERLMEYIRETISGMEFEFVYNPDYASTNNIYSLYLAREQLMREDTLLLESDLVFDKYLLRQIAQAPEDNLVAVAKYEHWMDGTVTILSEEGFIQEFVEKKEFRFQHASSYYKTVNIYKFSAAFSRRQYIPFLEAYIAAYGKNQYYESVLKALAHLSHAQLKAFVLDSTPWYEIDDAQDLDIAETIFAKESDKLLRYERHFGGYWRFPGLLDFCNLVNPYFPPPKMLDQMKYFYEPLLTQYPSGMSVQRLLADKLFKVDEDYLMVGNGAAELICVLGRLLHGRMALTVPAFNEYIRCFEACDIVTLPTFEDDFRLSKARLMQASKQADILAIINPDNPSGSFLTLPELTELLQKCRESNVRCIVDESFIDFAQKDQRYTLLSNELLEEYPNLLVIKSISKSYGVPGLRLGVLATSDKQLLADMRRCMPIWNINSFAEYFLQISSLYADSYKASCDKIVAQRVLLEQKLNEISFLNVFPSQASYIMCHVKAPYRSKEIAAQLLIRHNLLIKDLSEERGFHSEQYIRVTVKSEAENIRLYEALKTLE